MHHDDASASAAANDPLRGCRNVHETLSIPMKHQPVSSTPDMHTSQSFNTLPRSVRWRLNLRICVWPSVTDTTNRQLDIHSIQQRNASNIAKQRSRYTELERKHYWKSTPTCIANDTTPATNPKSYIVGGKKNDIEDGSYHRKSFHQVAPGDDPLSALLTVEARHMSADKAILTPVTKEKDCKRDKYHEEGILDKRAGRRWAEFYSTREVLDVIKKDLDRLPPDHYTVFHAWRMRMNDSQELKEKESSFDNETTYEIMEHQTHSTTDERAGRMSQILFVYAREHPEIGYRQGMHEVLDNVMLAFEGDMLLLEEEKAMTTKKGTPNVVMEHRLIDSNFILHDAFTLFECIMASLASAYDANPHAVEESGDFYSQKLLEQGVSSPLENLTASIMTKLQLVEGDEQLCNLLLNIMPVPPNLYFAKWIRLMFVREISGGMENALNLLDAFFELAWSVISFSSSELPINVALLDVWKAAACGMILLIRHKLIPTMINNRTMMGQHALDPNIGVGYLMNYPPLEDAQPLVETIVELLIKEKKLSNAYFQSSSTAMKSPMKQFLLSEDQLPLCSQPVAGASKSSSNFLKGEYDNNYPRRTTTLSTNAQQPMLQSAEHGRKHRSSPPLSSHERIPGMKQIPAPVSFNHGPISGTIGNIAEGIIDFSKTASAAITSFHKQFEGHVSAAPFLGHPLQNDVMILSHSNASSSPRKSLMELASTLETSTATLMKYFTDRIYVTASCRTSDSNCRSSSIPADIWDAMTNIDLVRKELLKQQAEKADKSATLSDEYWR